jgi:hypothetical protein
MKRLVALALAAVTLVALLAASAAARSDSSTRIRGTVAVKDAASHVVTLRTARKAVGLRVPGSLAAIRVGQRVELRGSTLRTRGNGSRVLARNVTIASSAQLTTPSAPRQDDDDDEVEIKGKITSLSPLTVASATRSVTCTVPAGMSLAGFAIGDFVEITCDLKSGTWVLRKLHHEDDDDDDRTGRDDDDDDRSGPGGGDHDDADDDDDHSGHGNGDDDDDDDDDHGGHGDDDHGDDD